MRRADRAVMAVTAAVLLAACGGDEKGKPPGAGDSPSAIASEEPGAPAPVVAEHGGTYFGVYLATGEGTDIEDAINYLSEERGLEPGQEFAIGDVSCDQGAQEALGEGAGPMRVAVYFASQEDAEAWSQTLPAPPITIAEVQTL